MADATDQTKSRGISWLLYALALILAAIAILALAQEWVRPTEDIRSAKVAVSSNASAPLVVRWGVSDNLVQEGDSLALWFQFMNPTDAPVTDVGFSEFSAPGFIRGGACWNESPKCITDGSRLENRITIQPGHSLILEAPLVGQSAGRYSLTAVYRWRNAAGAEVREAIALGPIEVASWWQIVTTNVFGRLAGVIVPLSLAVAGLLLQRFQFRYEEARRQQEKEREDERRQHEKARDEERRRAEQDYDALRREEDNERARDAAVLNTLLPTQMTDTKVLYQPLTSKINMLIRAHERWSRDRGDPELQAEIAFGVATFWRQQQLLIDRQGGFHLQSRAGEKLVRECFNTFKTHLLDHLGRRVLAPASRLPRRLDLTEFMARPDTGELVKAIRAWVLDPADPLTAEIPTLKVLRTVLGFEINRPFERWYGDEALDFPEQELRALRQVATTEKIDALFDDYLKKNLELQ